MLFLSQLLLLCCSFSSHTCPQSYGWCDTIYRSVKSSRISQICGYCGWILTCINCKMRKHKRTQVCCSCILLNSWCGYVQKLSIQMKKSQQETVFLRIFPHFQMQQPSCLSSDNLREKQASHLHCRVTGRDECGQPKWYQRSAQNHFLTPLFIYKETSTYVAAYTDDCEQNDLQIKVHPHTDRPAVTQVYTLISGKCLRPTKVESHGNKDQYSQQHKDNIQSFSFKLCICR